MEEKKGVDMEKEEAIEPLHLHLPYARGCRVHDDHQCRLNDQRRRRFHYGRGRCIRADCVEDR